MTWLNVPIRRALVLFVGAVAGVFAVLPHPGQHLGEFAAYAVVAGAAVVVGTVLSRRPTLSRIPTLIAQAAVIGAVTAVFLVAADALLVRAVGGVWLQRPPVWTGLLYALAGGVSEEVVFHYGLLVAIAWIAFRVMPPGAASWLAIAGSAVAMGLSDLPSTATVLPLTPLVVARTVTLTALGGAVSGWLYWRRGLEAAMVTHGIIGFALHDWAPGTFLAT